MKQLTKNQPRSLRQLAPAAPACVVHGAVTDPIYSKFVNELDSLVALFLRCAHQPAQPHQDLYCTNFELLSSAPIPSAVHTSRCHNIAYACCTNRSACSVPSYQSPTTSCLASWLKSSASLTPGPIRLPTIRINRLYSWPLRCFWAAMCMPAKTLE